MCLLPHDPSPRRDLHEERRRSRALDMHLCLMLRPLRLEVEVSGLHLFLLLEEAELAHEQLQALIFLPILPAQDLRWRFSGLPSMSPVSLEATPHHLEGGLGSSNLLLQVLDLGLEVFCVLQQSLNDFLAHHRPQQGDTRPTELVPQALRPRAQPLRISPEEEGRHDASSKKVEEEQGLQHLNLPLGFGCGEADTDQGAHEGASHIAGVPKVLVGVVEGPCVEMSHHRNDHNDAIEGRLVVTEVAAHLQVRQADVEHRLDHHREDAAKNEAELPEEPILLIALVKKTPTPKMRLGVQVPVLIAAHQDHDVEDRSADAIEEHGEPHHWHEREMNAIPTREIRVA
mmetsp:Transcript_106271/g.226894  ORF Transcript_106271/g.226894 Transcript_106271/m.226894 type:complete len:343 (+) Transcript_106271:470-1498(+)